MSYRRFAGKPSPSNHHVILKKLLMIKSHCEMRLRKQIVDIEHQQQVLIGEQQRCQSSRIDITAKLFELLEWKGVLSSNELLEQKQKMNELFTREHALVLQKKELMNKAEQLDEECNKLQKKLILVLKKEEKIKVALSDDVI